MKAVPDATTPLLRSILSYLVVNVLLVMVWALTGAGEFWPAWILAFWGGALALRLFPAERV
jgi:2TM domain